MTKPKHLFNVRSDLFLVLTGPLGDGAARTEWERFRVSCQRADGQPRMFDPEPLFTRCAGTPEVVREHVEAVVVPALATGRPVVLEGGWWPHHRGDDLASAIDAGITAWGATPPTLTALFPGEDRSGRLRRLADWAGPAAIAVEPGATTEMSLQVLGALARRKLYGFERPAGARRGRR